MAGRILALSARSLRASKVPFGACGISDAQRAIIGNREVVGFGVNGEPHYLDTTVCPMPAIRWKESTPDVLALREKEKGDWKKLTIAEKKALYRASFRQTFAEFSAPTGDWKFVTGSVLLAISAAIIVELLFKAYLYNPLPETFDEERQKKQLQRMIDLKVNPIEGIASTWDYENQKWK